MRKSIWISSLVVIVLLLGFVWYYYSYIYIPVPKGALTNVTELYSKFTPYMKNYVNSHLEYIKCEPKYYYYTTIDNISSVCFVCKVGDACFGYGLVSNGKYMNPRGIWIKNPRKINPLIPNYFTEGMGMFLRCEKINNTDFICDFNSKIHLVFDKNNSLIRGVRLYSDLSNFCNLSRKICEMYNKSVTGCNIVSNHNSNIAEITKCENMKIYLFKDNEIKIYLTKV